MSSVQGVIGLWPQGYMVGYSLYVVLGHQLVIMMESDGPNRVAI